MASTLEVLESEVLDRYQRGTIPPPTLWRDAGYLKSQGSGSKLPVFVASEESEDRMGDIIEAAGWKIDNFQKNPVFMLAHSYDQLPIGTVPAVGVNGKQLLASVKFDTDDPIGASVAGKYQRGVMRAVSVGFRALEFEPNKAAATRNGLRAPMRFTSVELLEISAVAVPAHPAALAQRSAHYARNLNAVEVTTTITGSARVAPTGDLTSEEKLRLLAQIWRLKAG